MLIDPGWVTGPKRRRLRDLQGAVDQLGDAEHVQAKFIHPVFGCYTVIGPARWSSTISEFTLGCALLTVAGKPSRELKALTPADRTPVGFGPSTAGSAELVAGDLVIARVTSFGDHITVVGPVAHATDRRMWAVGRYLVESDGEQSRGLISLHRCELSTPTELYLPAVVGSWVDFHSVES